MLPKKAIIAIVVASLLLLGYEGLSREHAEAEKAPNLLLGFAVVGAIHALQTAKEFTQPL